MEHDKMIHTAQLLDRITKVISIIVSVVSMILAILGAIGAIAVALGNDNILQGTPGLSFGPLSLELADGVVTSTFSYCLILCLAVLACGIFVFVVSWIGFHAIRSILTPMAKGRPFDVSCSRALKTLAGLTLIGGLLFQIGKGLLISWLSGLVDLSSLFAADAVTGISLNYTFGINFIIYAMILYLLSYVFRYGEMLQKESDETL